MITMKRTVTMTKEVVQTVCVLGSEVDLDHVLRRRQMRKEVGLLSLIPNRLLAGSQDPESRTNNNLSNHREHD